MSTATHVFANKSPPTHPPAYPQLTLTIPPGLRATCHASRQDPVTYTAAFDAVVRGVRKHADPAKTIKFVGLNLPNIDNADTIVRWASFFLNGSNHAPDTVDALDYIGVSKNIYKSLHLSSKVQPTTKPRGPPLRSITPILRTAPTRQTQPRFKRCSITSTPTSRRSSASTL